MIVMRLKDVSKKYPILREAVERIEECDRIDELFPPQEEAIKKKVLDGKNLILCTGTGSGKTLIGELAALKCILERKKKVVYLVPLRALAAEKYHDFKRKYEPLGIRIALSIGDMDSADPWIERFQIVVCTYEKADSLIRHGAPWLKDVGLLIVDEAHDINLPDRGPTLEIVIVRLIEECPNLQVIGLSATIGNPNELAGWLNSEFIESDFRPIPLYEGVYYDGIVEFIGKEKYEPVSEVEDPELKITEDVIRNGGQVLLFVNTRREAEATAKRATKVVQKFLTPVLRRELKKVSNKILNALEVPTKQCKKLANCVLHGASYHHAGLLNSQRKEIEDAYRKGMIKFVAATPTLIAGVNLPSRVVIIRNLRRYFAGIGMRAWPVSLYKQAVGRAGRIKFDKEGIAIIIAKSEDEAYELTERYILGEPEEIYSKLALEPVLRVHTLALIASGFVNRKDSLFKFFSKTFYAHQYGDISEIELKIQDILEMLIEFGFIVEKRKRLYPTRIGKRVSELYIDPLTAHHFIQSLKQARKKKPKSFSYLHMIANTLEMRPLLSIRGNEFEEVNDVIARETFLQEVPEEWDLRFDDFLKSVKTAMMLEAWMNELTEDQILSKYRVTPGELRTRLKNADWLLYSANEITLLLGFKDLLTDLRKVRVRMKYGVKEELIPLVRLEQVGRVRARKLYNTGVKTISDLRKIPLESLKKIIGPRIAATIKKQLGEKVEQMKEEKQITLKSI